MLPPAKEQGTACPNDLPVREGTGSLRDDEDCKGFSDIQAKYGIYGPTYENNLHDFSNLMIIAKTMQDYKKNLSGLPFL